MSLFQTNDGSGQVVKVQPYVIYTARVQPNADPTKDPTWANWHVEDRLVVRGIYRGSSFGGPSYAKLALALGQPADNAVVRLEEADVLQQGDRVAIAYDGRVLFCGYQTHAHLLVAGDREELSFRISGPEWVWGASGREGAQRCVIGQLRRVASADDAWALDTSTVTPQSDLRAFLHDRCVFNPDGRKNMSLNDCTLSPEGAAAPVTGRVFETLDRKLKGAAAAAAWTMQHAVNTLLGWYNDPAFTGIARPDVTPLPATAMRTVDVDGMGLYDALANVMGPQWGFAVDPRMDKLPSGQAWGPFKVSFGQRGQGPAATVWLNELNTPASAARPGLARLEAIKDIAKTVNKVTVVGGLIRHVTLWYRGKATTTATAAEKKVTLQHGWPNADGSLQTYANGTPSVLDDITISSRGKKAEWQDRYTTSGKLFPQYAKVFRLFTWNEDGALQPGGGGQNQPFYGVTAFDWYTPDLTGIADGLGADAGQYCRRSRKLLDTPYYAGSLDGWQRVPPTLYMAAMDATTHTTLGPWIRVEQGRYRVDPERGAVWIIVPDLSIWCPFLEHQDPAQPTVDDNRTFATLLVTGDLRMALDCSIEADPGLDKLADRQDLSGSPFVREAYVRAEEDFVVSQAYAGEASPSGLTGTPIDNSTDAQAYADQLRDAMQDQQAHASLLMSGDAQELPIFSVFAATSGRQINIAPSTQHGAQVVGQYLDPVANKWEFVTESAALRLRDSVRLKLSDKVHGRQRVFRHQSNQEQS